MFYEYMDCEYTKDDIASIITLLFVFYFTIAYIYTILKIYANNSILRSEYHTSKYGTLIYSPQ